MPQTNSEISKEKIKMTRPNKTIQEYEQAKLYLASKVLEDALKRAQSFRLYFKGSPTSYIKHWSHERGGNVTSPGHWTNFYLRYVAPERELSVRISIGANFFKRYLGTLEYNDGNKSNKECTTRYSTDLNGIQRALTPMVLAGVTLEGIIEKIGKKIR